MASSAGTRVARALPPSLSARGPRAGASARPRMRPRRAEAQAGTPAPAITLTDNALKRLMDLKASQDTSPGEDLLLRMGVKQGGCSGMSYFMDFESSDKVAEADAVMKIDGGLKLVCDPKSLLYLFGMQLDFSNELVGGGFKFNNPNATSSCGCGKSFAA
mmetsp:Transcript_9292/g.23865  ORF Transcript_9292/g.23865 Transcript_9292/m.23865 type:complete len:160 (+) Transcript_9292:39-518(+)